MRLYIAGNMMTRQMEVLGVAWGIRNRLLTFAESQTFARAALAFWTDRQTDRQTLT